MDVVVGLLGATGYTGGLTAAALDAAGVRHRRGGRSAAKLAALPRSAFAEDVVVDTTDPAALDAFLDGCDVVISTVGPFQRLGAAVVEAAVRTRTPYVDSCGEPAFLRWLFTNHRDAPVPLVPSCAFDYVPGDLAVALATEGLCAPADVREALVGHRIEGAVLSRGTIQSVWGAAKVTPWWPRRVRLPFPSGARAGASFPWGEQVTVAQRSPRARVVTALATGAPAATALHVAGPLLRASHRTLPLLDPVVSRWAARRPDGPEPEVRQASRFETVARVVAADGRQATAWVRGSDGYGLTARWLVAGATRVAAVAPGARTTAEVFDPGELLAAAGPGLAWGRG